MEPIWAHLSLCYVRSRDLQQTHLFVVQQATQALASRDFRLSPCTGAICHWEKKSGLTWAEQSGAGAKFCAPPPPPHTATAALRTRRWER